MKRLLAEHADLHVACLKWPRTTGPQAQPTWMLLVGHASDKDASPWNLFEPELIGEANLSSALPTTLAAQWILAHEARCAAAASISDFAEALGLH